jgi:hypothetical protein
MEMIAGCQHLGRVVFGLGGDMLAFLGTALRSRAALAADLTEMVRETRNISTRHSRTWLAAGN